MGHDITGFKPSDKKRKNPISILRRGALDSDKKLIYRLLDAYEFYKGDSGKGDGRVFSESEIKSAIKMLSGETLSLERVFLKKCESNLEDGKIFIFFN